jgi:hypothetical protein
VGGTCGTHGGIRGVYRVFVRRLGRKRPFGRPTHRWEDNIKMDLREVGIDGVSWIQLAQGKVWWQAFMSMVMNLQVP